MSKNVHFQTSQLDSTAVLDFLKAVLSLTKRNGAGEGNRTPVRSLGSSYSTIELRPLVKVLTTANSILFSNKMSI